MPLTIQIIEYFTQLVNEYSVIFSSFERRKYDLFEY
nr:MAG TPA: hypothetical protein [Caudoviricetes sp.]DAK43439.1 MAG TPA: hypothetical protein [Caudoviricetes sp.]